MGDISLKKCIEGLNNCARDKNYEGMDYLLTQSARFLEEYKEKCDVKNIRSSEAFLHQLSLLCSAHKIWIGPREAEGNLRVVSTEFELPVFFEQDSENYRIEQNPDEEKDTLKGVSGETLKEFYEWCDKAVNDLYKLKEGAIKEEDCRLSGKADGIKIAKEKLQSLIKMLEEE